MVAKRGYTELADNGDRYLVAAQRPPLRGHARARPTTAWSTSTATRCASSRKRAKSLLPVAEVAAPRASCSTNPTPLNLSELTWRVGLPVSALILAFLALPLSAVNPRTGRFVNVLVAVFLFMIYSNLISIFQAWVAKGKINRLVGMLGVHVAMVLLLVVLLVSPHVRLCGCRVLRRR